MRTAVTTRRHLVDPALFCDFSDPHSALRVVLGIRIRLDDDAVVQRSRSTSMPVTRFGEDATALDLCLAGLEDHLADTISPDNLDSVVLEPYNAHGPAAHHRPGVFVAGRNNVGSFVVPTAARSFVTRLYYLYSRVRLGSQRHRAKYNARCRLIKHTALQRMFPRKQPPLVEQCSSRSFASLT